MSSLIGSLEELILKFISKEACQKTGKLSVVNTFRSKKVAMFSKRTNFLVSSTSLHRFSSFYLRYDLGSF